MTTIINNLSIANYRSFGSNHQRFDRFSSINLIIGRNNSGKSNILRFLAEELPAINAFGAANRDAYSSHDGQGKPIEVGFARASDEIEAEIKNSENPRSADVLHWFKLAFPKNVVAFSTWQLQSDGHRGRALKLQSSEWRQHLSGLGDNTVRSLWASMLSRSGGSRDEHWIPELAFALAGSPQSVEVHFIPAKRELRRYRQSDGSEISILEKLASIERPAANDALSRRAFSAFQQFVRRVLGDELATVEVQSDRSTINVELGGRILPVESLGSGVSEVILLAAATTALHGKVVCLEEPEIHLNPLLQKQLISYLAEKTDNQYFIATHSASLMDTAGAEIYHVQLEGAQSVVRRATSDPHRTDVCSDLGYQPSDLLIANCVIWVEGPSDRIYLNWWIKAFDNSLLEGIHYSIMFYGGRLASHLTFSNEASESSALGDELADRVDDFIKLRRLNPHSAIVLDSDKRDGSSPINETKIRLVNEFSEASGKGFAWVTQGREIENYVNFRALENAITEVHPKSVYKGKQGDFDDRMKLGDKRSADKVEVARHVAKSDPDMTILDLRERISTLVDFIRSANPGAKAPSK